MDKTMIVAQCARHVSHPDLTCQSQAAMDTCELAAGITGQLRGRTESQGKPVSWIGSRDSGHYMELLRISLEVTRNISIAPPAAMSRVISWFHGNFYFRNHSSLAA